MKQLKIGVDVDDVLLSCVPYALERENKNRFPKDAVKIEEITAWGVTGKRSDCIFNQFNKADSKINFKLLHIYYTHINRLCQDIIYIFLF